MIGLNFDIFNPNTYKGSSNNNSNQQKTTPISNTPTYTVDQFKPAININPGDSVVYSSVTFTGKTDNITPSITITNPNNTNTNQNNNGGNAVTPVTNIVNDILSNKTTTD